MGQTQVLWQRFYGLAMALRWGLSGYDQVAKLISLMVPGWQNLQILDVGSGPGRIASDPRFSGVSITCVDAQREAVEACRALGLSARLADVRDIPNLFAKERVDIAWCLDILEHLEKQEAVRLLMSLERIARLQIVVFLPLGYFPQDRDPAGFEDPDLLRHRSSWKEEDLVRLGYQCQRLAGFHWDIRMYCSSLAEVPYPVVRDAVWAVKKLNI